MEVSVPEMENHRYLGLGVGKH